MSGPRDGCVYSVYKYSLSARILSDKGVSGHQRQASVPMKWPFLIVKDGGGARSG